MSATPEQDLERILGYLEIGDCWEWTLSLDEDGYGQTSIGLKSRGNYRRVRPHRFIYEQLVGPVERHLVVDHLCRNRKCCNPDHLEPVTNAENVQRGVTGFVHKAKTHCPQGHSYADAFIERKGNSVTSRHCRVCSNARRRANYQRVNAKAAA